MIIKEISKTMTTEEWLQKKEQDKLDRIFDEAIHEAHQKQLEEMSKQEHEEYVISLITRLSDLEAELSIMENLHKETFSNTESTTGEKEDIKKQLKVLKQKYTKTKNELDRVIKEEQEVMG